jgi:hypothetical protein
VTGYSHKNGDGLSIFLVEGKSNEKVITIMNKYNMNNFIRIVEIATEIAGAGSYFYLSAYRKSCLHGKV